MLTAPAACGPMSSVYIRLQTANERVPERRDEPDKKHDESFGQDRRREVFSINLQPRR